MTTHPFSRRGGGGGWGRRMRRMCCRYVHVPAQLHVGARVHVVGVRVVECRLTSSVPRDTRFVRTGACMPVIRCPCVRTYIRCGTNMAPAPLWPITLSPLSYSHDNTSGSYAIGQDGILYVCICAVRKRRVRKRPRPREFFFWRGGSEGIKKVASRLYRN